MNTEMPIFIGSYLKHASYYLNFIHGMATTSRSSIYSTGISTYAKKYTKTHSQKDGH